MPLSPTSPPLLTKSKTRIKIIGWVLDVGGDSSNEETNMPGLLLLARRCHGILRWDPLLSVLYLYLNWEHCDTTFTFQLLSGLSLDSYTERLVEGIRYSKIWTYFQRHSLQVYPSTQKTLALTSTWGNWPFLGIISWEKKTFCLRAPWWWWWWFDMP